MQTSRRTFILAGGGALVTAASPPSDQVVLGLIGSGGRGNLVMSTFQKDPALKVGAICDVYEPNLERGLSNAKKGGSVAKPWRNYKQLLADKDIQAVLIATPEHWHAQMVLDALAAGKDVYVEKPLCRTPEEGVALVAAEKKTKQIVEVGMQRRSYDLYQQGREVVASGQLGNVRMIRSEALEKRVAEMQVLLDKRDEEIEELQKALAMQEKASAVQTAEIHDRDLRIDELERQVKELRSAHVAVASAARQS
ncbi:MAG: Gfo/Idh/MocA family oxidoreductase [Bryobacteraceae bacterium]|nr:Gfo/Idh/MocA family oxidoreductase [Bryobacteraceae bacterium]